MKFIKAPDIYERLKDILTHTFFPHIKASQITCMRSFESKTRARARIWSFPRIWQLALRHKPHYIIEVISQHFDSLSDDDQTRILIHELLHIPKTFSGALRPHRGMYVKINRNTINKMFQEYKTKKSKI